MNIFPDPVPDKFVYGTCSHPGAESFDLTEEDRAPFGKDALPGEGRDLCAAVFKKRGNKPLDGPWAFTWASKLIEEEAKRRQSKA
jgi:hypothetical protein